MKLKNPKYYFSPYLFIYMSLTHPTFYLKTKTKTNLVQIIINEIINQSVVFKLIQLINVKIFDIITNLKLTIKMKFSIDCVVCVFV